MSSDRLDKFWPRDPELPVGFPLPTPSAQELALVTQHVKRNRSWPGNWAACAENLIEYFVAEIAHISFKAQRMRVNDSGEKHETFVDIYGNQVNKFWKGLSSFYKTPLYLRNVDVQFYELCNDGKWIEAVELWMDDFSKLRWCDTNYWTPVDEAPEFFQLPMTDTVFTYGRHEASAIGSKLLSQLETTINWVLKQYRQSRIANYPALRSAKPYQQYGVYFPDMRIKERLEKLNSMYIEATDMPGVNLPNSHQQPLLDAYEMRLPVEFDQDGKLLRIVVKNGELVAETSATVNQISTHLVALELGAGAGSKRKRSEELEQDPRAKKARDDEEGLGDLIASLFDKELKL